MDAPSTWLSAHAHIREALRQLVTAAGDESSFDANDLHRRVTELETALAAHLQEEDEQLYPALSASRDPKTVELCRRYQGDMLGVTVVWNGFLHRWHSKAAISADPMRFGADVASMARLVEDRMDHEERELYPARGDTRI